MLTYADVLGADGRQAARACFRRALAPLVPSFTCFTGTKNQILTLRAAACSATTLVALKCRRASPRFSSTLPSSSRSSSLALSLPFPPSLPPSLPPCLPPSLLSHSWTLAAGARLPPADTWVSAGYSVICRRLRQKGLGLSAITPALIYMYVCMYVYIHTDMHTYIHTYIHTYMSPTAFLPFFYIHTFIHTYIYVYTYTFTYIYMLHTPGAGASAGGGWRQRAGAGAVLVLALLVHRLSFYLLYCCRSAASICRRWRQRGWGCATTCATTTR
jgi:hypothetical protein